MRQKKIWIRAMAALTVLLLTGCGKNKEIYDSGKDGYTSITAVDGICFDVMSDVARNATAVTNISEDMSFEPDQTYVYKDGGNRYFIFQMDSIVYVAEKGVSFGLRDAEDKLAAVQDGNIMGIYFTSPRKKLDFVEDEKNGVYKLSATVTAQVAVTSELYNDFAGRFSYLSDGTEEWAVFVGTRGEDFKELPDETKEVITYMAATVTTCDPPEQQEEKPPAVSLGGEAEAVSENRPQQDTSDAASPETDQKNESVSDNAVLPEEEPGSAEEDAAEETKVSDMLPEEPLEVIEVEEITAPEDDSPEESPETETFSDSDQETVPKPVVQAKEKQPVQADNQRPAQAFVDGTVYRSDIYSLLPPGKKAYATALLSQAPWFGEVEVCADRILTGKEARDIIQNAFAEGAVYGEYFEAPEGCAWQAVHYTVSFPGNTEGYINVKLRGMDGDDLRYRGITYPHRSYDIPISDTEFYAFYAVPNGCPEYVLEIGEGNVDTTDERLVSAYYRYQK